MVLAKAGNDRYRAGKPRPRKRSASPRRHHQHGSKQQPSGMVESASVTQEIAIVPLSRNTLWTRSSGPSGMPCHEHPARDVEEVRALKAFFNSSKRTVITSFKSQIGHTLGSSGINSLIRGVTAMKAEVFPSTLNYMHPDPEIDLEGSGLLIAPEPLDWKAGQPAKKASGQRLRVWRFQLRCAGGAGHG